MCGFFFLGNIYITGVIMIGIFKIKSIENSNMVIAESEMNNGFIGRFYIPPVYRESCSKLSTGDRIFGVLDDDSGFGALLFKFDDGITDNNALNLSNDLIVNGNSKLQGTLDVFRDTTINGMTNINNNLIVSGTITGNAPQSTINLTAAHAALILAAALSGTTAPLPEVPLVLA